MAIELIREFGKDAINSLTKYPSIPTFHVLGERGRLTSELTHDFAQDYSCTEKADGTNVRIITYQGRVIVGSREELCYMDGDVFYNPSLGIVDALMPLLPNFQRPNSRFEVFYGELYGARIGSNWKHYGETPQFRLFDAWSMSDSDLHAILGKPIKEISTWRESDHGGQNQPFISNNELIRQADKLLLSVVTPVEFDLHDTTHQGILNELNRRLPRTHYGDGKSEGVVIRSADRKKIAKIRFEDYARTLR